MQLPGQRVIALEITPDRVSVVEVEPGRRPKVYAWATVEGPFADDAAMVQRIKEVLAAGGFTADRAYVAAAIPVEHRHLSLPPLSRRELRRVVEREVRRDVTVPIEERIFDYGVVGETVERGGPGKKEVLLAIAARAEVNRHIQIVQEVGLSPWLFTSRPLALMAALSLQDTGGGPVVCANLHGALLQVVVAEEGILHLSREISLPTVPGEGGVESWEPVTTEIHRSLMYFLERSPRWRVGRILVAGSSANLGGLRDALAEDPTVRVEVFDPKRGVDVSGAVGDGPVWRAAVPSLAIPLGLATRRPEVGISLLPREVQERKWARVRRVVLGSIVAANVSIGIMGLVSLEKGERNLQSALQAHLKTLSTVDQQIKEVEEVERERELHRARANLLERGVWSGPVWIGILREISLHAHPELLLHSLKMEEGANGYRMVLKGEVTSRTPYEAHVAFNRFYEGVQRSPFLATVTLQQPLRVSQVTPEAEGDEAGEKKATEGGLESLVKTSAPVSRPEARLQFDLALELKRILRR
jgi:Tfp pilus assembly PilM family ATPase